MYKPLLGQRIKTHPTQTHTKSKQTDMKHREYKKSKQVDMQHRKYEKSKHTKNAGERIPGDRTNCKWNDVSQGRGRRTTPY